ncbi:hypothetical protein [Gloeothece verrucosa]|uniref:Uncharacterized protein n=1 Tax=Gloeothece verrucosa (strain PCC 7822) TaxID=497965 RepID=E0UKG8_GLOV7|nr:hypothetical protein [Gloeothece verrucosa]ADN17049.1 hypothetical protein Cyan7822_5166 [Gloeothece verrucosa PCC 7822]
MTNQYKEDDLIRIYFDEALPVGPVTLDFYSWDLSGYFFKAKDVLKTVELEAQPEVLDKLSWTIKAFWHNLNGEDEVVDVITIRSAFQFWKNYDHPIAKGITEAAIKANIFE